MAHTPTPSHDGAVPASLELRLLALRRRYAIDVQPLAKWRATPAGGDEIEIAEGDPWPTGAVSVAFDRHTVTIPSPWPLADVRLDLDVGGDADVVLHSRFGRSMHRILAGGGALPAPARAFGIRIDAHAAGGAARLGATRLLLVGPDVGDALARIEAEPDPDVRERALLAWELRAGANAGPPPAGTDGP